MSSNSPKDILTSYGFSPSKSLGQNFLINKGVIDKMIQSADIKPDDTIIEIGPGLGVITEELAKKAKTVIAVEKDRKMAEILTKRFASSNNITIIQEDILKLSHQIPTEYKVVANLPYNIAAAIIRQFLENPPGSKQPELMVLMVQKEVGQRICATPPDMSILAVSVQIYSKPEIVGYVSAGSFWPMPKVDSAIIKITDIKTPGIDAKLFFKIVKAGFSQPRKQIGGNLSKILKTSKQEISSLLLGLGLKPEQRAETLSIKNWLDIVNVFEK